MSLPQWESNSVLFLLSHSRNMVMVKLRKVPEIGPSKVYNSHTWANRTNSDLSVVVRVTGFCSHTSAFGELKFPAFIGLSLLLGGNSLWPKFSEESKKSCWFSVCSLFVVILILLCYVDGSQEELLGSQFLRTMFLLCMENMVSLWSPWWLQTHCHHASVSLVGIPGVCHHSQGQWFSPGFFWTWNLPRW